MENTQPIPRVQRIVAVLWPSFLVAGAATMVFFTAFDPHDLAYLLRRSDSSSTAVYSIGFFFFWLLTFSACALSCYFQRPCTRE